MEGLYRCLAAGDSYNDLQMFEVAEKGFFINAPKKISNNYPEIESFDNYKDLKEVYYQIHYFKNERSLKIRQLF